MAHALLIASLIGVHGASGLASVGERERRPTERVEVAGENAPTPQGMTAANAFQFNASRTAATALLPSAEIKLMEGSQFVTWGSRSSGYTVDGGLEAETGTDAQVWNLRKCSAGGADLSNRFAACTGNNAAWTLTTSPIVSGDVVTWVNKQSGKLYDCANTYGRSCYATYYPPNLGMWGSVYTIKKLSPGGSVESDGTPIYLGDDVYFYGLQGWAWADYHIIDCRSYCNAGNGNTISGSTFTIVSSAPAPSPTPAPTPAPTTVPAATPPPAGGAGAGASAVGDPHLQNVHGERFDLMKAGKHVLINIPRGTSDEAALLRVLSDARRLGGHCADMYFQELNVTGSWAEAKRVGGYHYSVSQRDARIPEWVAFGKVELKVVHGRTENGLLYLNLYVKHLGRAGFAVGGLLGEDDHEDASTPPVSCSQRMALVAGGDGGPRAASSASASFE